MERIDKYRSHARDERKRLFVAFIHLSSLIVCASHDYRTCHFNSTIQSILKPFLVESLIIVECIHAGVCKFNELRLLTLWPLGRMRWPPLLRYQTILGTYTSCLEVDQSGPPTGPKKRKI